MDSPHKGLVMWSCGHETILHLKWKFLNWQDSIFILRQPTEGASCNTHVTSFLWCHWHETILDWKLVWTLKSPSGSVLTIKWTAQTPQIGAQEVSLCILLVLKILGSNTKLIFVLMLSAWCVFHVCLCFICASFKITYISIGFVCVYFEFIHHYQAHDELKKVSNQHIV